MKPPATSAPEEAAEQHRRNGDALQEGGEAEVPGDELERLRNDRHAIAGEKPCHASHQADQRDHQ
jgi:hypothetical protein